MLERVKADLGITGNYQDETLRGYIAEVKQFLIDGGVSVEVIEDSKNYGIISRGVIDLWNYGSGARKTF